MAEILKTRNDLLKLIPKYSVVAELGVYEGVFSQEILNICEPKKLYLVDLWSGGASKCGDKDGLNYTYYEKFSDVLKVVRKKFKELKNVSIVQEYTTEFLLSIPNDSLNAVYIDATHDYENVKKELNLSRLKVKNGGFIMGHDYATRTVGVIKAVDEFCKESNLEVNYLTQDLIPSFCIINGK